MIHSENLHPAEESALAFYDCNLSAIYRDLYGERTASRELRALSKCVKSSSLNAPDSVLDAAAGTGNWAFTLSNEFNCRVAANEVSPGMREILISRAEGLTGIPPSLEVIDPAVVWSELPRALAARSFDMVTCLGGSLAHCDPSLNNGNLQGSLAGMSKLVRDGGFLFLDCKRYDGSGIELTAGAKRRSLVEESPSFSWTAPDGSNRSGTLISRFFPQKDRSLIRSVEFLETAVNNDPGSLTWEVQVWPIYREMIIEDLEALGFQLSAQVSEEASCTWDFLLFRKMERAE